MDYAENYQEPNDYWNIVSWNNFNVNFYRNY